MLFCPEKGLGVMLQSIREFADDARRSQKTLINLVKSLLMVSSPGKIIIFCRQRRETKNRAISRNPLLFLRYEVSKGRHLVSR